MRHLAARATLAVAIFATACGGGEGEVLVGERADGITVVCTPEGDGVYGCDPETSPGATGGGDDESSGGECASFAEGGAALVLWPPNHVLHTIDVAACARVRAGCGAARAVGKGGRIVAVTSDEPGNVGAGGDGHTDEDVDVSLAGASSVLLRAERQGGGDGRIYRIEIEASAGERDACEVHVPHDRGPFGGAVDSGEATRVDAE